MGTRRVSLVITDLDNTLYDWVGWFVPAFYAMSESAAEILEVDLEKLLNEIRDVHRHHGSSEHPFSLLETKSVQEKFKGISTPDRIERLDAAFYRFNSVRKHSLVLYEGVLQTLAALESLGVSIAGYTDARIPNSMFRVNSLGLDRYLSHLYAPAARFPSDLLQKENDPEFLRILPEDDKKPNQQVLLDICRDLGVHPANTIYVGDSLSRDVFMANGTGVRSAWARYGTLVDPELWKKLVRITHWTEEDIKNDAQLRMKSANATPDYVLNQFSDILECVRAPV